VLQADQLSETGAANISGDYILGAAWRASGIRGALRLWRGGAGDTNVRLTDGELASRTVQALVEPISFFIVAPRHSVNFATFCSSILKEI